MNNPYNFKKAAGVLTASLIITGCASTSTEQSSGSWDTKRVLCVAASSLAGAALDAAANNNSDATSKSAGGVIGAGLGAVLCAPGVVLDNDKDGVIDKNDQCPHTTLGREVDPVGCELDDDNDKVVNALDQCPDTLEGVEVDKTGCPVFLDQDGDGVEDAVDQCPDTPLGTAVNEIGCEEDEAIVLKGIFFEYKSSELTDESKTILDAVASKLISVDAQVIISGHTDSIGGDKYNLNLSEERASTVKSYLIEQGLAIDSISSQGFGEANPIATNDTDEGRAQNRRVEMELQ